MDKIKVAVKSTTTSVDVGEITTAIKGDDGFSPIVEITEGDAERTISITDATHTVETVVRDGEKGEKGEKGDTGADGYTPIRGTDYWTVEDISVMHSYIDEEIGVVENGAY